MRGDDERRATGERGDQSCRNEEVGVHDVRSKATRGRACVARKLHVLPLAAPPARDDGVLDDVPARRKSLLHATHEHTQVGVRPAGIHLGDKEDPHV